MWWSPSGLPSEEGFETDTILAKAGFYYAAFCTLIVTAVLLYYISDGIKGWYHRRYWDKPKRTQIVWPVAIYFIIFFGALVVIPIVKWW